MVIMSVEQLAERIRKCNLSQLSRETGLHQNSLRNIRDGAIKSTPKLGTILTLTFYFHKAEAQQNV